MYIIFYLVVIISFRLVYCEWIQISQSSQSSDKVEINQSPVKSNGRQTHFDYSKYKDFFSVIEPDIDFDKDVETSNKNISEFIDSHNRLNKNDFPVKYTNSSIVFKHPFDHPKDNGLANMSVFSGPSTSQSKPIITPVTTNQPIVELDKHSESIFVNEKSPVKLESNRNLKDDADRPNTNQMKIVLKRTEFKPFSFDGVFKFFANIQQSISLKPSAGIQNKISFLENFKNNLLNNIG